jgi:hypothetical protein
MSNELVHSKDDLKTIESLASYAQESKFFAKIGGMGGIISIMLYAKELGLPPMQCLFDGMHNINGKIALSAAMMNSMVRKAGHRIEILAWDEKVCTLKGTRKDTGDSWTETFTMEQARLSGDTGKDNWKKHPKNMLFARATKNLCRALFADSIGSAYVEGEIEEGVVVEEHKTFPIVPISPEEPKAEEHKEVLEEISLEEGLLRVASSAGILNDEFLKTYMEDTLAKYKISVAELTKMWIENKDKFIQNYERRKEKLQASTTNPETQVS